jgi:hypothetical protein
MSYGIILGGNSPNSNPVFKIQKIIKRIIMNAGYKDSGHPLFMKLNILPLYSQYKFSLSTFVVLSNRILKYTVLILGKALTYIHQKQI